MVVWTVDSCLGVVDYVGMNTVVMVVGIVEIGSYDGILAGMCRLKNASSRGIIRAVIDLRMKEWRYRFARMRNLNTAGTGIGSC